MSTITPQADATVRPSPEELIARAEALVPVLRERARTCEELRRVPDETIDDLERADLLRLVAPASAGGLAYGMREFGQITRILAQGCASTAWVYSFLVVHNVSLTQDLPELVGERGFGAAALSAGFQANTSGTAKPVDGGWKVTGRWPFASAIMNSDYILLITTEAGHPPEEPKILGLVADVGQGEIEDVWHFQGMKGTGSNTFALQDSFIPDTRQWTVYGQERLNPPVDDTVRPLEGFSIIRMFDVLLAAVAVGSAEAALQDFKQRILTREVGFGMGPQREHPEAWSRYGNAYTTVRMARLLWDETHRIVTEHAERNELPDLETACALRMASPRICQTARDAIQVIAEGSGSSVNHADNPLQRQMRDVDTLKSHSYLHWDGASVTAGAALLGVTETPDPLLVI